MLIGLLIVLGLVGVAAAQQPRSGGTLRVTWEADISGLDPHVVHDRVSQAETALHNAVLLPTLSKCKLRKNYLPSADYVATGRSTLQGRFLDGNGPC